MRAMCRHLLRQCGSVRWTYAIADRGLAHRTDSMDRGDAAGRCTVSNDRTSDSVTTRDGMQVLVPHGPACCAEIERVRVARAAYCLKCAAYLPEAGCIFA